MSKKLYKYIKPDTLDKVFSVPGKCTFRCSYPKGFNDPYELFLTIDFNQEPDVLAFYKEIIGEIPQLPTTCFSKSPEIVPMWAHYSQDFQGIVIEIDEKKLTKEFPDLNFRDIDYRDGVDKSITSDLYKAKTTYKPRHTYLLQRKVLVAAYFTKSSCWSYELERRLVTKSKDVIDKDGLLLLCATYNCITSLIFGSKATHELKGKIKDLAKQIGCKYYEFNIGKSTSKPYFVSANNVPYIFTENVMVKCDIFCSNCEEPIEDGDCDTSPWCAIEEKHEEGAAERNPLRLLEQLGLLSEYCKGMEDIRLKYKK